MLMAVDIFRSIHQCTRFAYIVQKIKRRRSITVSAAAIEEDPSRSGQILFPRGCDRRPTATSTSPPLPALHHAFNVQGASGGRGVRNAEPWLKD
jgi:hypothetical protein